MRRSVMMQTLLLPLLTFLLLADTAARATQVLYRSPRQLGKESSLVVRGKVVKVNSYWNASHTKIFTKTTVAVDETYKGRAPIQVRIVQLGGIVGSVNMHVAGSLSWRKGEEVLLFLEPYDSQSYRVSGFFQGKFSIVRDSKTGRPMVRAPLPPTGSAKPSTGSKGVVPSGPSVQPALSLLDEFVQEALADTKGGD